MVFKASYAHFGLEYIRFVFLFNENVFFMFCYKSSAKKKKQKNPTFQR